MGVKRVSYKKGRTYIDDSISNKEDVTVGTGFTSLIAWFTDGLL
jgi:hypothetical protein